MKNLIIFILSSFALFILSSCSSPTIDLSKAKMAADHTEIVIDGYAYNTNDEYEWEGAQ